ncbi:MAG: hypothetical protein NW218_07860 [Saprospiraceae bacterium]|nr:hypothetical protein [Saprospiraceae bacterium]
MIFFKEYKLETPNSSFIIHHYPLLFVGKLPFWNMKFFKMHRFLTIILFMAIYLPGVWAQGNRDFMRETGKINVVVGVILLIFVGIVWFLLRIERKLTKLEHQLKEEQQ